MKKLFSIIMAVVVLSSCKKHTDAGALRVESVSSAEIGNVGVEVVVRDNFLVVSKSKINVVASDLTLTPSTTSQGNFRYQVIIVRNKSLKTYILNLYNETEELHYEFKAD